MKLWLLLSIEEVTTIDVVSFSVSLGLFCLVTTCFVVTKEEEALGFLLE